MTLHVQRPLVNFIAVAIAYAGLWSPQTSAQSNRPEVPLVLTESYRAREAFQREQGDSTVSYDAGQVIWLRYRDNDSNQVSVIRPGSADQAHARFDEDEFHELFERYYHASRVKEELHAANGVSIPKGAVVVEHFFDDNSVWVSVEGDVHGGVYEVPKRDYMRQVESLDRAGVTEIPEQYQEVYELLSPFLGAHSADNSGKKIDLDEKGTVVEAIEDGRDSYSWAKKIRVLSGSHKGREVYVSASQLENEENSRLVSSPPNVSLAEPEEEYDPPAQPRPGTQPDTPTHVTVETPEKPVVSPNFPPNALRRSRTNNNENTGGGHGESGHSNAASNEQGEVDHLASKDEIDGIKILPSTIPGQCDAIKRSDYRGTHPHSKRSPFHDAIIKASNSVDGRIHPAILEASVHLETDFRPFLENEDEKTAAIRKYGSYSAAEKKRMEQDHNEWGKGLCQFGPAAAKDYGLQWDAPKPKSFTASNMEEYNKKYPNSVWNTEACLAAKARYMLDYVERDENHITLADGKEYHLKDYVLKRGDEHAARALLSFFNRGVRYVNSLQAYYSRYGALPENYGQAWSARVCSDKSRCKPPQRSGTKMLHTQHINRRHVLNGAGLCGEAPERSFFGQYSKNYTLDSESGEWKLK